MLNDSGEKFIGEFLLRLWRFEVRRYFSMGDNLWAETSWETAVIQEMPVTAVIFVRNTGGFAFFSTDPPLS